jgi:uncharacterized protein
MSNPTPQPATASVAAAGLKLIACDPIVGLPRMPLDGTPNGGPTIDDLQSEMARLRITSAVVRHRACIDNNPYFGNDVLMEETAGRPDLIPAWVLTPDGREPAFDVASTVTSMLQGGVKVAWMSPKDHAFSVRTWCAGEMYEALQSAQAPLLLDYNACSMDDVDPICAEFPQLRLVIVNASREGRHRLLYPLLKRYDNICLVFNPAFSVHDGYKDLVNRFGPHRWLFGMGYPTAEGGAAIAGLMYAGLSDAALQSIAHANIERLLSEVQSEI